MVVQKIKENCPSFDIQATFQKKVGSVLPGKLSWCKFYQNYLKCFQFKSDFFGNFLLIQYVYSHCQISHLKSNVSN